MKISISTEVKLQPYWNQRKLHCGFQQVQEAQDPWGRSDGATLPQTRRLQQVKSHDLFLFKKKKLFLFSKYHQVFITMGTNEVPVLCQSHHHKNNTKMQNKWQRYLKGPLGRQMPEQY